MSRIEVTVPDGTEGERIDRFLASLEEIASRGMAQRLVREGRVWLESLPVRKISQKISSGMRVRCEVPEEGPTPLTPWPVTLDILYEDTHLLVVNKPPHMVIHPAPGHADDTLVNALLAHTSHLATLGGRRRPGIVHRLDKGTSGALIVAKTNVAYLDLVKQFKERGVKKTYLAIVYGQMEGEEGVITHAILRSRRDRKKMAVSHLPETGRQAETRWRCLEAYPGLAFLELNPQTGRTHQLRVHLSAIGHPILGDPVYGRRAFPQTGVLAPLRREVKTLGRQALHASRITFTHPATGRRLTVKAPCPPDLRSLHRRVRELLIREETP